MADHIVILTGGGLPGVHGLTPEIPDMPAYKMAEIMGGPGEPLLPGDGESIQAVARAGWEAGFREAAILHRVVCAWVFHDDLEAQRFADFVTVQIDPAYVRRAGSPVAELLSYAEQTERERTK